MSSTNPLPQETIESRLLREVHVAINNQVLELREWVIANAVKQFEEDLRAKVGTVAINLANFYSVERRGESLVITVRLEGLDGSRTV